MIYRGPGFLAVEWFGSSSTPLPPPPFRQQVVLPLDLADGRGGGGGAKSYDDEKRLALYKSFITLWSLYTFRRSHQLLHIQSQTCRPAFKFSSLYKEILKGSVAKSYTLWLTASSYMVKYLRISSYIRKPFLMYDFATDPIWISLSMRKTSISFLSVKL